MAYRAPEKRGHSSFCPASRHGSGMSGGSPHHSWLHQGTAQMISGGEDPAHAPSTDHGQPALPGSSPCTEQNCPNVQSSRATLPSHSGAQLHPPQGTQGTVCDLKDITVPCPGIRDHLTTRYASQHCKGTNTQPPVHLLQNPSVPEMELSTGSSPQAQVLYPEGRARDATEEESPATSLRLGIYPGSRPERERDTSPLFS